MTKFRGTASRLALTSCFMVGVLSAAAPAGDLSRYRDFQFGMDLPAVAKLTGANPSQATLIHSRPALIQELEWRPQLLHSSSQTEPVKQVVFNFYDGELFRMTIDYDRYQTAGLTAGDLIEAISAAYGIATKPTGPADVAPALYGDPQEVLAEWQDAQYRFDLIGTSYGPGFRLVGVLKRLEAPFRTAIAEAARLDQKEAPQKELDRQARESETERAKLEKARLVNKPHFRM
jgi:hypothetical protein